MKNKAKTSLTMYSDIILSISVQSISPATLQSCAVTCSHMNVITTATCNIYYVENITCKAGILKNPDKYFQVMGSSLTLVPVKVVDSTVTETAGHQVIPGNCIF
jgi:hypothetical protein